MTTTPSSPQAQDTTPTPTASSYDFILHDVLPKSVITFGGLAAFVLIGLAIAKIADRINDHTELRDDVSDISEHTRDLLKARLALFAFSPAKLQGEADRKIKDMHRARKFGRLWMAKAAISARKKREDAKNAILKVVNETSCAGNRMSISAELPSEPDRSSTPQTGLTVLDESVTAATTNKVPLVSFKPVEDATVIDIDKPDEPSGTSVQQGVLAVPALKTNTQRVTSTSTAKVSTPRVTPIAAGTAASKAAKRNNDFIAIDIQNLDDSTETREGSTIPSTPRNTYIEFRDVFDDVTIPVRVSTDDMPRPRRTTTLETIPPPPKMAYADSEFGSEESLRQSCEEVVTATVTAHTASSAKSATNKTVTPKPATSTTVRSRPSEGLEITSLSRDNSSSESLSQVHAKNTIRAGRSAKSAKSVSSSQADNGRSKTPGLSAVKRDSRPVTSRPSTSRVTSSRPLTAGRAQAITQGGRGNRPTVHPKSASRRVR